MKKSNIITIIILLIAIGTLVIIRLNKLSGAITDENSNPKKQFSINETAVFKDIHYTVKEVYYTNGSEFDLPPVENKNSIYVAVTFEVQNNSKKEIKQSPSCVLYTQKTTSEQETIISIWHTENNSSNYYLKPGKIAKKTIFMEISKEDSAAEYRCYSDEEDYELIFDLIK